MLETTAVLAGVKTVTLTFGGLLTMLSFRAYRRTGSSAMGVLTTGIGLVTAGALVSGVLHQFAGLPLADSVVAQSVFTALGLAVMTYSLYARPTTSPTTPGRNPPRG
jgi:hypothetical protein